MGNRVGIVIAVTALAVSAAIQPLAATAELAPVLPAERAAPGQPCHQPASEDDSWANMDFSHLARVGERFDNALQRLEPYGGTYWHEDGGVRVRIASQRPDSALTVQVARELIDELGDGIQGGASVESTDVSLNDLREWAAMARGGLTDLAKEDIAGVSVSELCQYVQVHTKLFDQVTLSAEEKNRYAVSPPPVDEDHSRDTDQSPYYGGVRLWRDSGGSSSAYCTGGFTMLRGGTRFLTTAGHCSELTEGYKQAWYTTAYGNYVGTEWLNRFECKKYPTNPCQRDSLIDVMLIAYMTYHSPIWFGGEFTTQSQPVTAKEPLPMQGTLVYISGGNSGLQRGTVENRYDTGCTAESPAVRVQFLPGYSTVGGDSGSPVVASNTDTAVQGDMVALGTHMCRLAGHEEADHAWYARIDLIEGVTDSSLVLSAG